MDYAWSTFLFKCVFESILIFETFLKSEPRHKVFFVYETKSEVRVFVVILLLLFLFLKVVSFFYPIIVIRPDRQPIVPSMLGR